MLQLVVRGASDKIVARSLGISYWTVRTHLARLVDKAAVRSRGELVFATHPAADLADQGMASPASAGRRRHPD